MSYPGGAREARDASDAEDLSISAVSIASLSPGADSRIVGGSPTTIENFPYAVQSYNITISDNDVAVLVLSSNLRFKDSVQSASIPFQGETLADNTMVVAVGWGMTIIGGGVSNVLNQVSIRTVNQALCRERYAELSNFTGLLLAVTDNMFCAGLLDIGGADTCQGDSGGPLSYNGVIVGITSWGASCAHPTYPGVYTEVSKYANWINETLTKYNGSARDQAAGIIAVLMPLVFLTSVVNEIH
ncbi:unnamed protein product [Arctia plantaginis]|uniref:Peptidase S1 domain-containing protein n=1 Tax=Arctia plantaginis TaxID=874455 RepID=A0A8S0ZHR3_ARCPL|nr:unnamed protein product [Arctia plantaginis]